MKKTVKKCTMYAVVDENGRLVCDSGGEAMVYKSKSRSQHELMLEGERVAKVEIREVRR